MLPCLQCQECSGSTEASPANQAKGIANALYKSPHLEPWCRHTVIIEVSRQSVFSDLLQNAHEGRHKVFARSWVSFCDLRDYLKEEENVNVPRKGHVEKHP